LTLPGNVPVVWEPHYYDKLQNTVGGGKPKMKYFFNNDAAAAAGLNTNPEGGVWPVSKSPYNSVPKTEKQKSDLVDNLQDVKTEFYCLAVETMATARPGVLELMDAAIADPRFKVGICSAATKAGFEQVVNSVVGLERLSKLDVVLAGDDVKNKKPDPEIYNKAKGMIGMDSTKCIVVEDSMVGLKVGVMYVYVYFDCGNHVCVRLRRVLV
jgi:HAD superfamily hydrolase (TIGR01509 family)